MREPMRVDANKLMYQCCRCGIGVVDPQGNCAMCSDWTDEKAGKMKAQFEYVRRSGQVVVE